MNQVQASSFPALAGALLVAVAMSGCDQLCGKTGKLCVGQLNDTAVTTCSNADTNGLPCNDTSSGTDAYRGQDAEYGRDVTANDDRDGRAGFVFTKLGADGKPLAIQNGTWDDVEEVLLVGSTGKTFQIGVDFRFCRHSHSSDSYWAPPRAGLRADVGGPGILLSF